MAKVIDRSNYTEGLEVNRSTSIYMSNPKLSKRAQELGLNIAKPCKNALKIYITAIATANNKIGRSMTASEGCLSRQEVHTKKITNERKRNSLPMDSTLNLHSVLTMILRLCVVLSRGGCKTGDAKACLSSLGFKQLFFVLNEAFFTYRLPSHLGVLVL